ncbi:MAG TPA: hypothetical protein PLI79_11120 [Mycobacterium sp.]|nr:hypothetical protein [Mycobacterium sp.]
MPGEPLMAWRSTPDPARRRWRLLVLTAAPLAVAAIGLMADVPSGTAVADCFQRGYQPPPCSAGGQDSAGATPQTPASAVPDSGINACQNQAAMATSLGLLPAVCPGTARG